MAKLAVDFLGGLKNLWQALTGAQKLVMATVFAGLVAAVGLTGVWSATPDMELLYGGLDPADSAAVAARLRERDVPYRVANGGTAIYVPSTQLGGLRMDMASTGLPGGKAPGFELFDKSVFGMSDFAQKVNYRRALEGELARNISTMTEIAGAKVVLTIPEKSLFSKERKQAKGSVVLTLRKGADLRPGQANAIRHLVASAVTELSPHSVAVIDDSGRLLSRLRPESESGEVADEERLAIRQQLEGHLSKKVQEMLDTVLGAGRSYVRVSAELSFSRIEKTAHRIDPESRAVIDETVQTDETKGAGFGAGGTPGVSANTGGGGRTGGAPGLGTIRKQETITNKYEYTKTTERVVPDTYTVSKLSVAAFIAQRLEGQGPDARPAPRSKEEIAALTEGIKSAIGYTAGKGRTDTVTVSEVPFATVSAPGLADAGPTTLTTVMTLAKPVGVGLLAIIALIMVRGMVGRSAAGAGGVGARSTGADAGEGDGFPKALRGELDSLVGTDAERASAVVRSMLQ